MKKQTPASSSAESGAEDKPPLKKRWSKIKPSRRNIDRGQRILVRHIRKFMSSRWENLRMVRREIVVWLLLVSVLILAGGAQTMLLGRNFETVAAVDGGTYAEGVVDKIASVNPLYAATKTEQAIAGLIYAGLFAYDETGHLRPKLAASYSISADGKTYNVKLRDNMRFADGQLLTADDVVLTVNLMKNPTVDSVFLGSFETVEIKKISSREVAFTLKNAYASFPLTLTFGILPAHILKNVQPADLRNFTNENAAEIVGAGAFAYRGEETLPNNQATIRLAANEQYFRGAPRLSALSVQTYATTAELLDGFRANEINVAADLGGSDVANAAISDARLIQAPINDGVFALFNNSGAITGDKTVREALRLGLDRAKLRATILPKVKKSGGKEVAQLKSLLALETPLARGLIADADRLKQPDYNQKAASEKLDAAGWKLNSAGIREKDGQTLTLNLLTVKGADYEAAAKNIAEQWRKLGAKIELTVADPAIIQQNYFIPREFDVLVYQLHLGADPDVFAYWASSQAAATGLNLANYESILADLALTNARTESDTNKRSARYVDFVKQWLNDVPAIALYQPNFYYLTAEEVRAFGDATLTDTTTRFAGVGDFTVKLDTVKNTL